MVGCSRRCPWREKKCKTSLSVPQTSGCSLQTAGLCGCLCHVNAAGCEWDNGAELAASCSRRDPLVTLICSSQKKKKKRCRAPFAAPTPTPGNACLQPLQEASKKYWKEEENGLNHRTHFGVRKDLTGPSGLGWGEREMGSSAAEARATAPVWLVY